VVKLDKIRLEMYTLERVGKLGLGGLGASKENTRGFCIIKRNRGRLRKTIREIWYYMIEHDDVV